MERDVLKVWAVRENWPYEIDDVHSLWATEAGANAECVRLERLNVHGIYYYEAREMEVHDR